MRTLLTLLSREIKSYFYQPIAYVVMFFMLVVTGFNFWLGVMLMNGEPTDMSIVELAFTFTPFWWTYVLVFPIITMRTYSEEFRMGTFETLTTAPVKDGQVVVAKFLGALFFYCVLWAPTFLHFLVFKQVAQPDAVAATGAFGGVYLLLLLMGMLFISVGCLASSLVKDQVNAAVICFCCITLWFFVPFLPQILRVTSPDILELFNYFSAMEHMRDFARGLIDSRRIVWYLTATAFFLFLNFQIFQRRKWKA